MVHQRFSTNTFPTLATGASLPHDLPQRRDQYRARQRELDERARIVLASDLFGDDIAKIFPVIRPGGSDTASLDNAVEMLTLAGRSLPHVMAMLIPEAWDADTTMPEEKRAFLRISRFADGAVGRPRGGGVHRRQMAGRDARSQRAASGALSGHQRQRS